MSKINYKSEFLNLVNDLTLINKSIIIDKNGDNILVKRNDSDKSVAYVLGAPNEYFGMTSEQIAFYNYTEFFQFLSTMENPDISIKDSKIVLNKGKTKINYLLSNPESIQPGPKQIDFANVDYEFELDAATIDELNKMHSLIKAKRCSFTTKGDEITLKIFNNDKDNSFQKKLPLTRVSSTQEEVDFKIFSEIVTKIPSKRNYKVSIKNPGYLEFDLVDESIDLKIYTALCR